MDRFRGRVALVTGASAGIGVAIARQLCVDHGMKVVGCARRIDRLKDLEVKFNDLSKTSGSGGTFVGVQCDLDQDGDIRAMFDWIKEQPDLGQVDVCICNAGIVSNDSLLVESPDMWRKIFNVNVVAASLCAQLSINLMVEKGIKDGQVIFINSTCGHKTFSTERIVFYNASKLALTCVVEGWRREVQELKDNQIRVGQISPGVVETEIFSTVKPDPKMPFKMEDIFKFLPNIKADHVAQAVVAQMSFPPEVQLRDIILSHVHEKS